MRIELIPERTLPAPPDIDIERVLGALQSVIDSIIETLVPVIKAVMDVLTRLWNAIARAVVPRKWWHLYKHAKRARTRKKYAKKIREAVTAALAGGRS